MGYTIDINHKRIGNYREKDPSCTREDCWLEAGRFSYTARRDFLWQKFVKSVAGDYVQTVHFALTLQILTRVACYARTHIMMLHS